MVYVIICIEEQASAGYVAFEGQIPPIVCHTTRVNGPFISAHGSSPWEAIGNLAEIQRSLENEFENGYCDIATAME